MKVKYRQKQHFFKFGISIMMYCTKKCQLPEVVHNYSTVQNQSSPLNVLLNFH